MIRCREIRSMLIAAAAFAAMPALGAPYHFRYDATSFPEDQGWERFFSDPDGLIERELVDGAFRLDTTASVSLFDSYLSPAGGLQLAAGEQLIVTWRMRTLVNSGEPITRSDVILGVIGPSERSVFFDLGAQFVLGNIGSPSPNVYTFEPGYHAFRFSTDDFRTYQLFVDEQFAYSGHFGNASAVGAGRVAFGDDVTGLASLSRWEYVDVAVVPEPHMAVCVAVSLVCLLKGKRQGRP